MAAVSDPGKITRDLFAVVVNDQGQHALWPAELDLPEGWQRQSDGMSRQAGLGRHHRRMAGHRSSERPRRTGKAIPSRIHARRSNAGRTVP